MCCRVIIILHLIGHNLEEKGLELEQMNAGYGEQVGEPFLTV
jgi:hypothetical protein